jgi:hypothetical protein
MDFTNYFVIQVVFIGIWATIILGIERRVARIFDRR